MRMRWQMTRLAAAPDDALLGEAVGYPVAPALEQADRQRCIVGSFSATDDSVTGW